MTHEEGGRDDVRGDLGERKWNEAPEGSSDHGTSGGLAFGEESYYEFVRRHLGSVAGGVMNERAKVMHWEDVGMTDGLSDDWRKWRARDWKGMVAVDEGILLRIGRGKLGWCSMNGGGQKW